MDMVGSLPNPELPDLRDRDREDRGEEVGVEIFASLEAPESEVTVRA